MSNCPNCNSPITLGQRFCGVCSYDLQQSPATMPASAPMDDQASPYAYSQPGYGYYDTGPIPQPGGGRTMMFAIVLVLAVCFAFGCGLVFGFEILPTLLGIPTRPLSPTPTPRPSGWLEIFTYWLV